MATYTDNYQLTKPTYAEQADVGVINSNMNKIDNIMHSSQISLAPAYDSTKSYAEGDVVMYELLMYKCISPTTGVWDGSKWERTTASESGGGGSAELDILGEASGAVASFSDGASAGLAKCIADINPVQDLHGYSKPWAGGAGKNLFDSSAEKGDSNTHIKAYELNIPIGTYTISAACYSTASTDCLALFIYSDGTTSPTNTTLRNNTWSSVTINATKPVKEIRIYSSTNYSQSQNYTITLNSMQVESGSSATSYEPYANICPISGHTDVTVTVASTSGGSGDDTTVSLGRTVYGGTLDVASGKLTVTWDNIASYAGETLTGEWLSSMDEYDALSTPTTGAQVAYELATPQTIQLTPQEVNSLLGQNNISADTGDIDIVYVKASAPIQPNPTGTPTATLSKLGIEGTVFEVPSGGGGSSAINYSTTEQVIGTWIDGKPLYAKTFHAQNVTSSASVVDASFLENNYQLVGYETNRIKMGGTYNGTVFVPSSISSTAALRVYINSNGLQCNIEGLGSGLYADDVYFTIRYTKITD